MFREKFFNKVESINLSNIIQDTGAKVLNSDISAHDIILKDIKTLNNATFEDITFCTNTKYLNELKTTKARVCIVGSKKNQDINSDIILLQHDNPNFVLKKVVDMYYSPAKYSSTIKYDNNISNIQGRYISPSAYISAKAIIGKNCYIGHNVVIEDYVNIGDECVIENNSVIDYGVKIGNQSIIHSNVSISYACLGHNVKILPGAKIGQNGFGFATINGKHHNILHIGIVIIGNDVEVGANTTIDRGSIDNTIIEDFCRIDNLVQIAHNVHIAKGSVIVAQAAIAGSSKIGQYCVLGGQVGINGHINIGDFSQVAAKAGVVSDIPNNSIVGGFPAVPIMNWRRQSIFLKNIWKK